MNKTLILATATAALLLSNSSFAHGSFATDSSGQIVLTIDGCLRTIDYTDDDRYNCPRNKKPSDSSEKAGMASKESMASSEMSNSNDSNRYSLIPNIMTKEIVSLKGVEFETGSNKLTGGSLNALDSVAQQIKANPDTNIIVEGHTDNVGDADANMKLSLSRAEAVRDHLIAQGVNASQLSAKGYGETKAVASNDTAEGRSQNRRVDLRIKK